MARELFNLFGVITVRGLQNATADIRATEREIVRFQRSMALAARQTQQLGRELTKNLTVPIIAATVAIGKTVQMASSLNETLGKTTEIFGTSTDEIVKWSEAANSIGQTQQQALDAAGTFAMFGKNAGLAGKELTAFSTGFVELASDLASFYDQKPEDAIAAIGSALRGQAEPIQKYGVLMNEATLKQKAFQLGIIETTKKALTPQQKILAVQALLYEQTKDAQGNFKATSDDLANSTRILKASFLDIVTTLGATFLPIAQELVSFIQSKVIPVVKRLVDWWVDLDDGVKRSIVQTTAFLAILGPIVSAVGALIPIISSLVLGFKLLTGAVIASNVALNANPIGLVITAIGALVIAIIFLYNNWDTVTKNLTNIWRNFSRFIEDSVSGMRIKTLELVKSFIDAVANFAGIIPGVKKVGSALKAELESLIAKEGLLTKERKASRMEADRERKAIEAAAEAKKKEKEEADALAKKLAILKKEKAKKEAKDKAEKDRLTAEKEREAQAKALIALKQKEEELERERKQAEQERKRAEEERLRNKKQLEEEYSEAVKEQARERALIEERSIDDVKENAETKLRFLEEDKQKQLDLAEDLNADIADIKEFYANKEIDIEREKAEKIKDINRQQKEDLKNLFVGSVNDIAGILRDFNNIELANIENARNKDLDAANDRRETQEQNFADRKKVIKAGAEQERKAIEDSILTEREKEKKIKVINAREKKDLKLLNEERVTYRKDSAQKIKNINDKAAADALEVKRRQAVENKTLAVFNLTVATIEAVGKSLLTGDFLGAAVKGVIGGAKIGAVLSQPIPLAKGALIKGNRGGVESLIGEGKKDELVMPVDYGIDKIVKGLVDNIQSVKSSNNQNVNQNQSILNIGTLVADKAGLRKLERMLYSLRLEEEQRRGLFTEGGLNAI